MIGALAIAQVPERLAELEPVDPRSHASRVQAPTPAHCAQRLGSQCGGSTVSAVERDDAREAWLSAIGRYREIPQPVARFNVRLLESLRPQWEGRVRPDTSMFKLLFTRPGSSGYSYDERVEVLVEAEERVAVSLVRMVPRRGEVRASGPVVVTGDYARPENAHKVVAALLMQLAGEDAPAGTPPPS